MTRGEGDGQQGRTKRMAKWASSREVGRTRSDRRRLMEEQAGRGISAAKESKGKKSMVTGLMLRHTSTVRPRTWHSLERIHTYTHPHIHRQDMSCAAKQERQMKNKT
ncbi:uncharacterized protein PV09_07892 [Verruconis gallopava]|uniref:Uncharacterized protein n=1 Tax=Verruconis gallopava TaxID=253628 RepID=A0A0D2A2H7_9PEZI|nr:uncharacterized protein PV09_07892 [Verruconis gallopava]KIW00535.1 hypothetical protein PV09_07892 [Verruconis gallopava]